MVETMVKPNLSIDADPHLQETALPQEVVVRSSSRWTAMTIAARSIAHTAFLAIAIAHASVGAQPSGIPELAAPLEAPAYPPEAKRYGIEGKAIIAVQVLGSGAVRRTFVLSSSGFNLLDAEALRIARSARFKPNENLGSGRSGWVRLPVRFALEGPPESTVTTEPVGLAPAPVVDKLPTAISITRDGHTYLGSRPLGTEDLSASAIGGLSIVIRADEDAPYGSIVRVIAAAQAAGVKDIRFSVAPPAR